MAELSIAEIAQHVGGELVGDPDRVIRGAAPLDGAGPGDLSFLSGGRYLPQLASTGAGAVLVPRALNVDAPENVTLVRVDDPYVALARILPLLYPTAPEPPGIHPTAIIGEGAEIGAEVRIEAYALLGAGVRLGDGVRIGAHAVLGDGCAVGAGSIIHAHATLFAGTRVGERCTVHSGARLGSDGFRFVFFDGGHQKVPHAGVCVIGDDVEIGANTTVDRGSIGDTTIGSGTKIDNLVQIGHNVQIGRHVLLVAQVGISGSTVVGDGAVLGGQVGTNPHVTIGAGARVGGRSGVTADIAPGLTVSGNPARPHRESMRAQASVFGLPKVVERLKALEAAVFGRGGARAREGGQSPD
jgi:UDP-3-O-[3-hydroxymyristoyl] glucosamine N-acyltransferase